MLFVGITNIFAIPAYPKSIPIITDGDTVYIHLQGDENYKFACDESGYTVLSTEDGWFYAEENEEGLVKASNYSIVSQLKMNDETKLFLSKTRKGILPPNNRIVHKSYDMGLHRNQSPAIGTRKALVILMQFRDKKFTKELIDFQRLFNEEGYTDDNSIGSVYDYYKWASYGQLNLKSDVLGPYTAKKDMSYYGGNSSIGSGDKNPYELFEEAINAAIKDVNLSDYDANDDGFVDNVHIIYAGYGEEAGASANAIWAHEMTFRAITIQGMKIDRYSCAPELRGNRGSGISRIGPHCHEIGHALGAMDYYDTDYQTGGNYLGTGDWDIMASGSWNNEGISPAGFNPYVMVYDFGWTEAKSLIEDSTNIIKPSTEIGNIYRIDTGTKNDYFLLENRNGDNYHSSEPGRGLLIFHIGPQLETKAATNTINSAYPQQCYVVCASSTYKRPSASASTYGKINSAGCPYPGSYKKTVFSDETTPAALTISGKTTGIRLSNIREFGDDIVLIYGNSESSDVTSIDEKSSWEEDFEQMKIPSSWEYSDIAGLGEFTITTKLSNVGTSQSPIAANGRGYAKYSALSHNGLGRHHTIGLLLTSTISLSSDRDYHFSIQVRKYAKLEDACDSIFINLYDINGSFLGRIISKNVINQDDWEKIEVSLPDSVHVFSLGIECNVDYGSIMFIDNLSVFEKTTSLEQIVYPKRISVTSTSHGITVDSMDDVDLLIYDYCGSLLFKDRIDQQTSKTYSLKSGIYILCCDEEHLIIRVK